MALLLFLFLPLVYAMATEIKVVSPSFPSQDFDVFIEINSSVELKGAQCDLSFNSSILQVESIENGNMFELWGGDFNSTLPLVDNKNGTIKSIVAFSIFNSSYKSAISAGCKSCNKSIETVSFCSSIACFMSSTRIMIALSLSSPLVAPSGIFSQTHQKAIPSRDSVARSQPSTHQAEILHHSETKRNSYQVRQTH